MQKLLETQVGGAASDLNLIFGKDVAAFNDMLRRRNIGTVIVKAGQ